MTSLLARHPGAFFLCMALLYAVLFTYLGPS